MKSADIDWQYLRAGLHWPLISLLVTGLCLAVCAWFFHKQLDIYAKRSVNQESVYENYDALVYRRRLVDRYHRRYEQFRSHGIIGRENRVDWIETIRVAATGLDLPSVSYAIEPQRQATTPAQESAGGMEIQTYVSQLELDLGLVHELDLLRFFERLDSEAPGLMKVDRCELTRQSSVEVGFVVGPNIVAHCSVKMFSIVTSDTRSVGPSI